MRQRQLEGIHKEAAPVGLQVARDNLKRVQPLVALNAPSQRDLEMQP